MAQRTQSLRSPARIVDLGSADGAAEDRLVVLRPSDRHNAYVRYVKPAFDRLCGGILLLLFAPMALLVGAVVAVSLGSPVFLRQNRVGLNGGLFRMYKFRTMLPDRRRGERRGAPRQGSRDRRMSHKTSADPRHTPVGRFLRKWSLDELPQLFNVVKGDMSLVGPRPELPHVVERYEPWQHARSAVRPGLTGLWQVTARGDGTLMHEHTEVDLEYIERVSLRTDLKIMLLTVPAMLGLRPGD